MAKGYFLSAHRSEADPIKKAAYNLYFVLNITGVGIGYYLASVIHKPSFSGAFIIISATLYMYATSLKQMLLIGNIVVALLLSFSVIIIGLFDLLPATYEGNQTEMGVMFSILIDYAIFTFIINLSELLPLFNGVIFHSHSV